MILNKTLIAKNRGTRNGKVQFIVLHDTAGSGTANDAKYLANDPEKRGISVDFCIPKDGTVFQLNQALGSHCTYHAGRKTKFRGHVGGGVNQHSIGIEIAQKADMRGLNPPYPDVQVRAVADVCRYLCDSFHLTKDDITTHKAIITDGSRTDPRNFPWDQFWAYFEKGTDTPQPNKREELIHIVGEGDTLWNLSNKYKISIEQLKARNEMNDASNVIKVGQSLIVG